MLRHEREQPIVRRWADDGRGGTTVLCCVSSGTCVCTPSLCFFPGREESYRKGGCFRHLEKRKGPRLPQMPPGSTFPGRGRAVIFFKSGLFMPVWPRHGSWWAIWNLFTSSKLVTLKLSLGEFPSSADGTDVYLQIKLHNAVPVVLFLNPGPLRD